MNSIVLHFSVPPDNEHRLIINAILFANLAQMIIFFYSVFEQCIADIFCRQLCSSSRSLSPALRAMCLDRIRALVLIICLPTFPAHPAAWAFMSVTAELAHHPRPCFSRTPRILKA
jgi:hypothetical protein